MVVSCHQAVMYYILAYYSAEDCHITVARGLFAVLCRCFGHKRPCSAELKAFVAGSSFHPICCLLSAVLNHPLAAHLSLVHNMSQGPATRPILIVAMSFLVASWLDAVDRNNFYSERQTTTLRDFLRLFYVFSNVRVSRCVTGPCNIL